MSFRAVSDATDRLPIMEALASWARWRCLFHLAVYLIPFLEFASAFCWIFHWYHAYCVRNSSSMRKKITQIAQILSGYHPRKGVDDERIGTHCLLQIRDFNPTRTSIDFEDMALISPGDVRPEMCLQPGDVVFLAKGSQRFGYEIDRLTQPTLASGYFFVLRTTDEVIPGYLAWYLNQSPAQRHFQRFGTSGAHMPVVSRDVLGGLPIPMPDLGAQVKIVEMEQLARREQSLLKQLSEKKRTLATAACLRLAEQSTAPTRSQES